MKKNRFITNILLNVIFLFSSLIFIKQNNDNRLVFKKYFFEDNFSFSAFNNWYTSHFGNIIPEKNMAVFSASNNNIYIDYDDYIDGVKFYVAENSPITILNGGVVVYKGDKGEYGNTIIIQGVDGIDYWYGNITNSDISLYDYVKSGDIIGESTSNYFTLVLKKNNKTIKYEDYKN